MANHYIRQDIEREMILRGMNNQEIATFLNIAALEKLNREKKGVPVEWSIRDPALQVRTR